MHPIEHLRHVARAGSVGPRMITVESAEALGAFGADPAGRVVACRQLLARHPSCGPLWTLAAEVLGASDPRAATDRLVDAVEHDRAPEVLLEAPEVGATVLVVGDDLPTVALSLRDDVAWQVPEAMARSRFGRVPDEVEPIGVVDLGVASAAAEVVVVEASLVGDGRAMVPAGGGGVVTAAGDSGVALWLLVGAARVLPDRLARAALGLIERAGETVEVVELASFSRAVTPEGMMMPGAVAGLATSAVPAELTRWERS